MNANEHIHKFKLRVKEQCGIVFYYRMCSVGECDDIENLTGGNWVSRLYKAITHK